MGGLRQTGRTTRQMLAAPQKAVFVVNSYHAIDYYRRLARDVGREDLQIVTPRWLEYGYQGLRPSGVVVDHYVELSPKQSDTAYMLKQFAYARRQERVEDVE